MHYTIPREALAVAALAAKEDHRAVLLGVGLETISTGAAEGVLRLTATDGKALLRVSLTIEDTAFDPAVATIIPAEAFPHAARLCKLEGDDPATENTVALYPLGKELRFESQNGMAVYTTSPIAGTYPPVDAVWPGAPDAGTMVDVALLARLASALKAAGVRHVRVGVAEGGPLQLTGDGVGLFEGLIMPARVGTDGAAESEHMPLQCDLPQVDMVAGMEAGQ